MKPNKFEQEVLKAAQRAQIFHMKMTDGTYLWESHESFLQNYVAVQLYNNKRYCVNIDYSPKKIRAKGATKSPITKMDKSRFDLVCWMKSNRTKVKAIIEVKVWVSPDSVVEDAVKISKYFKTQKSIKCGGYVLYYQDRKRYPNRPTKARRFIEKRFEDVEKLAKNSELGVYSCNLVHDVADYIIDDVSNGDPWGLALYRVRR